jgi:hypothetical protein
VGRVGTSLDSVHVLNSARQWVDAKRYQLAFRAERGEERGSRWVCNQCAGFAFTGCVGNVR